jgi:hypothetical protein
VSLELLSGIAALREVRAQLRVVVDLAVVDDARRTVGVVHRLMPAAEVDDGEPPVAQSDRAVEEKTAVVGATVHEQVAHGRDVARVRGLPIQMQHTH